MSEIRLVLVVPAYNEARRLDSHAFAEFVRRNPGTAIVFVDDGSSDGTFESLAAMGRAHGQINVLRLARNRGKAEAVRQGVLAAFDFQPTFIGYWDADLATPLAASSDLRAELEQWPEALLAMGARVRLLGREITRRPLRHYLGRVFATAVSLALNLPVYDTQCGAKLFRATASVRKCFDTPFLSRWIFDVELIARIASDPRALDVALVREVPLMAWRDAPGSKVRLADFVRAPVELARLRMRRAPIGSARLQASLVDSKELAVRAVWHTAP